MNIHVTFPEGENLPSLDLEVDNTTKVKHVKAIVLDRLIETLNVLGQTEKAVKFSESGKNDPEFWDFYKSPDGQCQMSAKSHHLLGSFIVPVENSVESVWDFEGSIEVFDGKVISGFLLTEASMKEISKRKHVAFESSKDGERFSVPVDVLECGRLGYLENLLAEYRSNEGL